MGPSRRCIGPISSRRSPGLAPRSSTRACCPCPVLPINDLTGPGKVTTREGAVSKRFVGAISVACSALWAVPWAGHFLIGALRRERLTMPVAWVSLVQGVVTAWLPAYLLLTGRLATP